MGTFVRSNCAGFKHADSSNYTHHQYKIWKDFKEMAENVLGFALDAVGGSIESFEKVYRFDVSCCSPFVHIYCL